MFSLGPVLRKLLPAAALLLFALTAQAQYQWRDENGRMVFSDKPPPSNVVPAKIIKTDPARSSAANRNGAESSGAGANAKSTEEVAVKPGAAGAKVADNRAAAGDSVSDKDLDAKRKAKEKADADRKKKEQAEHDGKLAKACDEMRTEARTLDSGMRVARVNKNGETEYLEDNERARKIEALKRDIKDSCKPA